MSFVYLLYNDEKLPEMTEKYLLLQFKTSHVYCLIPSYVKETDQATVLYYPSMPEYLKLFKNFQGYSKVCSYFSL